MIKKAIASSAYQNKPSNAVGIFRVWDIFKR